MNNPFKLVIAAINRITHERKVLKVVDRPTKTKPFVWSADADYHRIVLGINDKDGVFYINPSGGVTYRVALTK